MYLEKWKVWFLDILRRKSMRPASWKRESFREGDPYSRAKVMARFT